MNTQPDNAAPQAMLSGALASTFRGRFCDVLLQGRTAVVFAAEQSLYDLGEKERSLWFVRSGLVKVGTITQDGRELIYDVRKAGDVVGELCARDTVRRDRAVAVERTEAVPVKFEEAITVLAAQPALLNDLIGVLCGALADAYEQVTRLAADDVMHRLVKVLKSLAEKLGTARGELIEISAALTQEELAQMVMARRERVSTALNLLRQQGVVQYSARGRLIVDVKRL